MLRHAALCLYLLVQCTTAIEWDDLVDRVQDHHDTIGEHSGGHINHILSTILITFIKTKQKVR